MSQPVFASVYPVNLDLYGRQVLVVGGGPVAARKASGLLQAHAVVTVVAPSAIEYITNHPEITWHQRRYQPGELASYRLAITATNNPEVNAQVALDGDASNVLVNSADDPANCSFILPAVITRGDLQITVSTNGRSPAMAQWARRKLESIFTDTHGDLLNVLSDIRSEARARFGSSELPGWDDAINDALVDHIASGHLDLARQRVRGALGLEGPLK